ncbi:MAG TPA: sugar ABC transporter permease [Candidatus Ornithospirochaeta stercorigallinarum]|nr:sugar ABC transporter permease [Candidatus Ornithospirochaeta stercorigallinarum]
MKGIIKNKVAYLVFLLPALVFYLFAVFYPIVDSIRLSFVSWQGIGPQNYVGFSNYLRLFRDPVMWESFFNNLIYVVIVVAMQLLIGLLFAVLLTYMQKNVTIVKTLYYIPCIITTVAVGQMFRSMYATQPEGLFNIMLSAIGLGDLVRSWLADVDTVLVAVSLPEGWRFTGMYMVIYYAALISIDSEVSEAAIIDGASKWTTLWKIKIPMIKPVIILTLTMCITGALRGFDIPYLLTNGGPGNASELMSTYMYKQAFSSLQFGYGSAIAVFIIVESIIAVFVLKIFERRSAK